MKATTPIIYVNDTLSFRKFPKSKLWSIKYHIKEIIKIVLSLFKGSTGQEGFSNSTTLNFQNKKGFPVTLIIKEGISDYRVQTSRQSILFDRISKADPALVVSEKIHSDLEELGFSVFLNKPATHIKTIRISGFLKNSDDYKKEFHLEIDDGTIDGLGKPTYWIDVKIRVKGEELPFPNELIQVYIEKVETNDRTQAQTQNLLPYQLFSSELSPVRGKNKKQVLILSFDGISTEDIFSIGDSIELFPNISAFALENHWFKNAITSSTVTASSAASLMTGLGLPKHYIFNYNDFFLSPNLISLSPNIKTIGQKTQEQQIPSYGLFTFGRWAPQYGFSRGFNHYRSINSGALQNYPWLEDSIKTISNNEDNSFLFAMHHPGGHPPFIPTISNRYENLEYAAYIENIKYIDLFLGSIINHLKRNNLYDDALIIFLADHGRSLAAEYTRKVFQFTENRLRVPLIIKHPGWNKNDTGDYPLNNHLSAQSTVHEIVCDFMGLEREKKSDYAMRTVDDISWVCETVDYSRKNFIGLTGYDKDFKYTLFYHVDFETHRLNDPSGYCKHPLNEVGIAGESLNIDSPQEKKRVIESSHTYLSTGLAFSQKSPPESLGEHTILINQ
jgi:hypothetical protein